MKTVPVDMTWLFDIFKSYKEGLPSDTYKRYLDKEIDYEEFRRISDITNAVKHHIEDLEHTIKDFIKEIK